MFTRKLKFTSTAFKLRWLSNYLFKRANPKPHQHFRRKCFVVYNLYGSQGIKNSTIFLSDSNLIYKAEFLKRKTYSLMKGNKIHSFTTIFEVLTFIQKTLLPYYSKILSSTLSSLTYLCASETICNKTIVSLLIRPTFYFC